MSIVKHHRRTSWNTGHVLFIFLEVGKAIGTASFLLRPLFLTCRTAVWLGRRNWELYSVYNGFAYLFWKIYTVCFDCFIHFLQQWLLDSLQSCYPPNFMFVLSLQKTWGSIWLSNFLWACACHGVCLLYSGPLWDQIRNFLHWRKLTFPVSVAINCQ